MCAGFAPTAMRMPISRVRSVTLTSMMFMMPMPPTKQRHRGDAGEERRDRLGPLLLRVRDLAQVADLEVVVVAAREVVAVAEERR